MIKRYLTLLILICILIFGFILLNLAQTPLPAEGQIIQSDNVNWLNQLDLYVKIFGGIIVGIGGIFGLPIVILNFQKTRAEIRKLELEAAVIQNKGVLNEDATQYGNRIEIVNSNDVNIEILADPRFLAPLLLLLDFIFAWGLLTLLGYVIGFFISGYFRSILIALLAAILLVPIIREARRVKRILRPKNESGNNENESK